jgi:hypothetical protein
VFDQFRDVIYAGYVAEPAGSGHGGVAAARCDVEDLIASVHVDGLAEQLSNDDQSVADPCVVARRPRLLLAILDRC